MVDNGRLAEIYVAAADTLVLPFDIVAYLRLLAGHFQEVCGWKAAGVILFGSANGEIVRQHIVATSRAARLALDMDPPEGPWLDAYLTGYEVSADDLRLANDRWHTFAPRAGRFGFRAVHAFPMALRDNRIGCLVALSSRPGVLDPGEIGAAQGLANIATMALIQERALVRAEGMITQLQGALDSRIVIEQAKGMISGAFGLGLEDAFHLLRSYTRRRGLHLHDVASQVLREPAALARLVTKVHE